MCNMSWTPHFNLEKDNFLISKPLNCVSPSMGCFRFITMKTYTVRVAISPNCRIFLPNTVCGIIIKRKRGRPKTRWKDVCKRDMHTVGLREGDEGDRAYWKEMINNHSGDPR